MTGAEVNPSPLSSPAVETEWSYTPLPLYAFIESRKNFSFTVTTSVSVTDCFIDFIFEF